MNNSRGPKLVDIPLGVYLTAFVLAFFFYQLKPYHPYYYATKLGT